MVQRRKSSITYIRADVDYGESTAFTTYGATGIKVWIFKGEVMEHDPMAQEKNDKCC